MIYTAAVQADHPELEAARAAGIPVLSRAEALSRVVENGSVIGVSGTHGKTTTAAMAAFGLDAAGRDPTALVGGRVAAWGGNARIGGDDLFVVEADEYDQSFLQLTPTVAVVGNVEADHLECYGSLADLEAAFIEFAGRAERVVVSADDGGAGRVGKAVRVPVWRVGLAQDSDIRLANVRRESTRTSATLALPDGAFVELSLRVPGLHNLRNAALAVGAALAVDADPEAVVRGVAKFDGVGRRFELLGTHGGVTVIDDYAHHPSEIAATLGAVRQRFPHARVVAVFQPHLYSRTKALGNAMGIALAMADVVVVTDVYRAREEPIPGVSGELVARAARKAGGTVQWIPKREELADEVLDTVVDGDVVVTLGAGDVTQVGHEVVRRLAGMAA